MSEIEDRRQRAREAFSDDLLADVDNEAIDQVHHAVESAIETATRVQITPEILRAAQRGSTIGFETLPGLKAAFRAAGFEVVE